MSVYAKIIAFIGSFLFLQNQLVNSADICSDDLAVTFANAITASSQFAPNDKTKNYGADRGLLNATQFTDNAGVTQMAGWLAEKSTFNQWIQIELKDPALIRGIVSQGHNGGGQQWVTKYRVLYSEDCKTWHTVGGFNVTDEFFNANTDENTPVTNKFHCPVVAKCIRVNPLGWNKDIGMRLGVLGCPLNLQGGSTTGSPLTTQPTTLLPTQPPTQPPTQAPTQPPTQPSTQAPTQAPTQPQTQPPTNPPSTAKSGTGVNIPNAGGKPGVCVNSCQGRANGDYQSCSGCDMFVTCVWEAMYDKRPCPKGTSWDDNEKRCVMKSKTCP